MGGVGRLGAHQLGGRRQMTVWPCVCVCVKEWECVGSGWIEWAWDGQGRGIKMADWACLYFQWHFALRGRQRKKKCTASKAFKCAFFSLLQTFRGSVCEPHSLTFLAFKQKYDFFGVRKDRVCVLVPCAWCTWNGSLRKSWQKYCWTPFLSILNYHVLHFLAEGLRGVCRDCCFDTQWNS